MLMYWWHLVCTSIPLWPARLKECLIKPLSMRDKADGVALHNKSRLTRIVWKYCAVPLFCILWREEKLLRKSRKVQSLTRACHTGWVWKGMCLQHRPTPSEFPCALRVTLNNIKLHCDICIRSLTTQRRPVSNRRAAHSWSDQRRRVPRASYTLSFQIYLWGYVMDGRCIMCAINPFGISFQFF